MRCKNNGCLSLNKILMKMIGKNEGEKVGSAEMWNYLHKILKSILSFEF